MEPLRLGEDPFVDLAARTPDQDRRSAGAPWPLRHLPDGRGGAAPAGVRQHPCADQRPARTAFHSSVRMTVHRARSARPNAGDGTGAFGQGRDHASDGPISLHGRATPPARSILREPRVKILGEPRSVALVSRKERQMGNVGSELLHYRSGVCFLLAGSCRRPKRRKKCRKQIT